MALTKKMALTLVKLIKNFYLLKWFWLGLLLSHVVTAEKLSSKCMSWTERKKQAGLSAGNCREIQLHLSLNGILKMEFNLFIYFLKR